MRLPLVFASSLCALLLTAPAAARTWIVAPSGGDFTTIQAALDVAVAGDTILVREKPGGYFETLVFPRSGSSASARIVLRADAGHAPVVDATGAAGQNLVLLADRSWITVQGLTLRNLTTTDGSGIRITGAGEGVEIRDNVIHELRGDNAMGITVLGTSTSASIRDLVIDGNEIYDCEPAPSEALVLNGNVEQWEVTNNHVHDVDNIGIDFIGGEAWVNSVFVTRDGVCRGNLVERANSSYGGGYAAGIYVDSAKDIVIEGNEVTECDLGIEIGAENVGYDATGVVVRDNFVHHNDKVGIVFGGYSANVGRTRLCTFVNNTCYENDTTGQFLGELWIQHASDNVVRNNVFVTTAQNVALYSEGGNVNNTLDHNLWFSPGGANQTEWYWQGQGYFTFSDYRNGSGQDANGHYTDPLFVDAPNGDVRLQATSSAIDAGDPLDSPSGLDRDGAVRLADGDLDGALRVDQGAHEFSHARLAVTGTPTANATLAIDVTGTAGLPAWLAAGFTTAPVLNGSFGYVSVDLLGPHLLRSLGALPVSTQETLPPSLTVGTTIAFQSVALSAGAGSLSNPVVLTVE